MVKASTAAKRLHRADRKVARHASKAKDARVMRAAAVVAEIGDQPPLIALSAATLAIGLVLRRRPVAEAGARMLASHLLATAIKTAIKRSVDRTRPHAVSDGKRYRLEPGDSRAHDDSSFPSGHTAGAVAVTRAAGRVWPVGAPLLAGGAATIAALQLPTGNHYGSDVAAGAAIGLASEALVNAAISRLVDRA